MASLSLSPCLPFLSFTPSLSIYTSLSMVRGCCIDPLEPAVLYCTLEREYNIFIQAVLWLSSSTTDIYCVYVCIKYISVSQSNNWLSICFFYHYILSIIISRYYYLLRSYLNLNLLGRSLNVIYHIKSLFSQSYLNRCYHVY